MPRAKVTATPDYPVNSGKACPKGFQFLGHLDAPGGRSLRTSVTPTDAAAHQLGRALRVFIDRLKAPQQQHGPESVALLGTGQLTSEEFAYLGALAHSAWACVHGDGNTRQCMATAAVAHKQSFGFDAPPFTYKDFEESDVLVFVGSNAAIAHPIMWQRVKKNARQPRIVVDRSPSDRDGHGRRRPSTTPSCRSPTWCCSTGWRRFLSRAAGSIATSSSSTPRVSTQFRGARRRSSISTG